MAERNPRRRCAQAGLLATLCLGVLFAGCTGAGSVFDSEDEIEPLSWAEEAFVGKWGRYHAYDGSYQYAIFDADRTGCDWDQHGRNRKSEDTYRHWELRPMGDSTVAHEVWVRWPSGSSERVGSFRYDEDLYKRTSILVFARSTTIEECPA